jgi:hypothetical protein
MDGLLDDDEKTKAWVQSLLVYFGESKDSIQSQSEAIHPEGLFNVM